jgi:SAM-dependent methyltransferase
MDYALRAAGTRSADEKRLVNDSGKSSSRRAMANQHRYWGVAVRNGPGLAFETGSQVGVRLRCEGSTLIATSRSSRLSRSINPAHAAGTQRRLNFHTARVSYQKQEPARYYGLCVDMKIEGRRSRRRVTRSATGGLVAEQVIEVYDALAEGYADHYESGDPDRPFLNEFLSHLRRGARLVDVGCGTGSGTKYFFDHGMRVEGIDLSGRMIEVARRSYPHIRFTRQDIRNFSYQNGHLDAIWAGYSLFHMGREDFRTVLKKIRKDLVPNGIFGLVMQEGKGDVQFPEPLCPGKSLFVCLYSTKELKAILSTAGFNVIAEQRREPVSELEYPYQKLLLVSQVDRRQVMPRRRPC